MRQIAEFVAVLSRSLFNGMRRRDSRDGFAPSYRRATIMQASLAALGLLSSIAHGSPERHSGGSLAASCSVLSCHSR
jgi:hypothetical protein